LQAVRFKLGGMAAVGSSRCRELVMLSIQGRGFWSA